ncbi:hypothetical protein [Tsukamurella ocularis]|uniref:hypothetical protein n=1 Tax=Tsukamurella ocularis TaxID=1970234 RepID=UPI0021698C12|nr:hypothetical protein [Tsukamurella ocularis]MCS3782202.1 hypothetical protein [Tsukamurella ocularis]MCS3789638.1 hypothetical protein [Tsukamurella ocularis]MCS3852785.1 hypothetical protein [Tsukamurella ocularis]
MNPLRARQSGCLVSVAAAAAVLALSVYGLASCATFGDTTRELDAAGVRTTVREWTGASLPESLTVISASRTDAFMDPSMGAVFEAPAAGVDEFVGTLGERRLKEFAPDCSVPARTPVFTEIPGSEWTFDASSQSWLGNMQGQYESGYDVITTVESGTLERCRNIVTVFARPKSPYVDMAIQKKGDGTSRVVLGVTYT